MLKNAQYSRRECIEVVGIPSSVEIDQLELTVCRVIHHIGVNVIDCVKIVAGRLSSFPAGETVSTRCVLKKI